MLRKDRERYESEEGATIAAVLSLPALTINEIVDEYFTKTPNLISVDTEGNELDLLERFDFQRFRPEVFCVETLPFTNSRSPARIDARQTSWRVKTISIR